MNKGHVFYSIRTAQEPERGRKMIATDRGFSSYFADFCPWLPPKKPREDQTGSSQSHLGDSYSHDSNHRKQQSNQSTLLLIAGGTRFIFFVARRLDGAEYEGGARRRPRGGRRRNDRARGGQGRKPKFDVGNFLRSGAESLMQPAVGMEEAAAR